MINGPAAGGAYNNLLTAFSPALFPVVYRGVSNMANESIDIAIVGAGVSGVYSAWRLKTQHPGRRIVVFEGGRDVGGRLLSVRPPDIPNMVAELGGMRILPA